MSTARPPGDPASYDLERIREANTWANDLAVDPELREKAGAVYRAMLAESTWSTYSNAWSLWARWNIERGWPYLPALPVCVAFYIVDLGGKNKFSTIYQKIHAVSVGHRLARQPSPTKALVVRDCLRGVARIWGAAQSGKSAISIDDIIRLQSLYSDHQNTSEACRNLTIFKVGVATAERGIELSRMCVEDLKLTEHGFRVTIERSKTDPFAQGRTIWIQYGQRRETCPVTQLLEWLDTAGITSGPVFRRVLPSGRIGDERLSRQGISNVIKAGMALLGHDASDYGSHSLRVSFVTLAHEGGAPDEAIMDQTGHKHRSSTRRYLRFPDYPEFNTVRTVGM
jgi:integrase